MGIVYCLFSHITFAYISILSCACAVWQIHYSVTRNSEGSDAQACHKMWPCCMPRCVGVQFLILAIIFQVLGLWLAMVWLVST
jgi:hypothetical protein